MEQHLLTREQMTHELKKLGVNHGDTLFIHSSFKSLGPVEGGVETIIDGLEDAVGAVGLILMPSFNLEGGRELRAKNWNIETARSTVGWITEYFRTMPETYRSDHYSHSVAARGKGAKAFVAEQSSTYCHVVETMYWDRLLKKHPNAKFLSLNREKLGEYWDSLQRLEHGFIGYAECRLSSIRDFVDALFAAVVGDPDRWK